MSIVESIVLYKGDDGGIHNGEKLELLPPGDAPNGEMEVCANENVSAASALGT